MAEAKKNLFHQRRTGVSFGRPPHYETAEQLLDACNEYFELQTNKTGKCKPTITGLTVHVGFASRSSWDDNSKRGEDFSYVISTVKQFVASCYEAQLYEFNYAGAKFALTNIDSANWKDKTEQEVKQTVTTVTFLEDGAKDNSAEAD